MPLASSGVGIAVKAGAPKPDISTPEALKQTLLKAKSIAYSEPSAGGASGVYFEKLLERMGIAAEMRPKTKYPPAGGFSATLLISGEAELAVQQKPELLHVAGVEIVGMLPGDLNLITAFAAGLMPDCKHADAGKALIAFVAFAAGRRGVSRQGSRSSLSRARHSETYCATPLPNDQFSLPTSIRLIITSCGRMPGFLPSNSTIRA